MTLSRISVGSQVRHRVSGWAGEVLRVTPVDKREMVLVKPTRPRPAEVYDQTARAFVPTPDHWDGWRPMTVYADELEEWNG